MQRLGTGTRRLEEVFTALGCATPDPAGAASEVRRNALEAVVTGEEKHLASVEVLTRTWE